MSNIIGEFPFGKNGMCEVTVEIRDKNGEPITYSFSIYNKLNGLRDTKYVCHVCLCTNNQWVSYAHLRDDDVRMEHAFGYYAGAITPAEKMVSLLQGEPE